MGSRFGTNYEILAEAVYLLSDDNLVWDADFELIRGHLLAWLTNEARNAGKCDPNSLKIAKLLIDTTIN